MAWPGLSELDGLVLCWTAILDDHVTQRRWIKETNSANKTNIRDNCHVIKKNPASCLIHHFPVVSNVLLMRNPACNAMQFGHQRLSSARDLRDDERNGIGGGIRMKFEAFYFSRVYRYQAMIAKVLKCCCIAFLGGDEVRAKSPCTTTGSSLTLELKSK